MMNQSDSDDASEGNNDAAAAASSVVMQNISRSSSYNVHALNRITLDIGISTAAVPSSSSNNNCKKSTPSSTTLSASNKVSSSSYPSPSKRSIVFPPVSSMSTFSLASDCGSISSSTSSSNNNNHSHSMTSTPASSQSTLSCSTSSLESLGKAMNFLDPDITSPKSHFAYDSCVFMREGADEALEMATSLSSSKSISKSLSSHKSKLQKNNELENIPELAAVDQPIEFKPITLLTMINSHGQINTCAEDAVKTLHNYMRSNPKFTSMKNMPAVVRESYKSFDDDYINNSDDLMAASGCDAITIAISGNEVCIGHVGGSRAIILTNNGTDLQLTSNQSVTSPGEANRIHVHGYTPQQGKINGDMRFARCLGRSEFKKQYQNVLVSVPGTCHIRVNMPDARATREASTESSKSRSSGSGFISKAQNFLLRKLTSKQQQDDDQRPRSMNQSSAAISKTSSISSASTAATTASRLKKMKSIFILIGNSTVWDYIDNAEACTKIEKFIRKRNGTVTSEEAANHLIEIVLAKIKKQSWNTNNNIVDISVSVIRWVENEDNESRSRSNSDEDNINRSSSNPYRRSIQSY